MVAGRPGGEKSHEREKRPVDALPGGPECQCGYVWNDLMLLGTGGWTTDRHATGLAFIYAYDGATRTQVFSADRNGVTDIIAFRGSLYATVDAGRETEVGDSGLYESPDGVTWSLLRILDISNLVPHIRFIRSSRTDSAGKGATMTDTKKVEGCVAKAAGPVVPKAALEAGQAVTAREETRMHTTVGREAPDFEAAAYIDGGFKNIKLSDFRGKWVFLCFYPGDFTFV
jgi:hypothetical protein